MKKPLPPAPNIHIHPLLYNNSNLYFNSMKTFPKYAKPQTPSFPKQANLISFSTSGLPQNNLRPAPTSNGKVGRGTLFSGAGALLLVLFTLYSFQQLYAQTPPSGFSSVTLSSGWNDAVGITFNKSGTHMFVWERGGRVWVVENNQKIP